jgi:hypothetical protein
MRRLLLGPLLFVATVAAQPTIDDQIVAKLVSDLLPLKLAVASEEPLKDNVYTPTELQSVETYSQSQAMKRFQNDLIGYQLQQETAMRPPGPKGVSLRSFIGPDQGYKIAKVLTGKDLPEAGLKPLVEALVGMVESANECRDTRSPLQNSEQFRGSAEKALKALDALGVNKHDVHILMDSLFRGAINAASPPPTFKYQ